MFVLYFVKIILKLKKTSKRFFSFKDGEGKRRFPSKDEKWSSKIGYILNQR
jgi:hypothetical protein